MAKWVSLTGGRSGQTRKGASITSTTTRGAPPGNVPPPRPIPSLRRLQGRRGGGSARPTMASGGKAGGGKEGEGTTLPKRQRRDEDTGDVILLPAVQCHNPSQPYIIRTKLTMVVDSTVCLPPMAWLPLARSFRLCACSRIHDLGWRTNRRVPKTRLV